MSEVQKNDGVGPGEALTRVYAVVLIFEGTVSIHSLFLSEAGAMERARLIRDNAKKNRITHGMDTKVVCMEVEP
jgi:hypothetical protein